MVSSIQQKRGYINWNDVHFVNNPEKFGRLTAYNQSKLANVMYAAELAERLRNDNIRVYSLHPGNYHVVL